MQLSEAYHDAQNLFANFIVPMEQGPEWSDEERGELAKFLGSPIGRKLEATLRNGIAQANERAVISGFREPHTVNFQTGLAAGYKAFWAQFQFLSQVGAHADTQHELPAGAGGMLEYLQP